MHGSGQWEDPGNPHTRVNHGPEEQTAEGPHSRRNGFKRHDTIVKMEVNEWIARGSVDANSYVWEL